MIPVSLSGPTFKEAYMEYRMIFMETPKSSIALSKRVFSIVLRMVKVHGSLHFGGNSFGEKQKCSPPLLLSRHPLASDC